MSEASYRIDISSFMAATRAETFAFSTGRSSKHPVVVEITFDTDFLEQNEIASCEV